MATPHMHSATVRHPQVRFTIQLCWLGWVLIAATDRGVCMLALGDTTEAMTQQIKTDFPQAQSSRGDPAFEDWVEQILTLIEHPQSPIEIPLDIQGTTFQQEVWQALQQIPPGTTLTYKSLAQTINRPKSVRAVARACATNQVSILIPCHRVIGSDGGLRGYRWGCDRKRALLNRESAISRMQLSFPSLEQS